MVRTHSHFHNTVQILITVRTAKDLHGESGIGNLCIPLADTQLTMAVITPGPNCAVRTDCHRKVIARHKKRISEVVRVPDHHIKTTLITVGLDLIPGSDNAGYAQASCRVQLCVVGIDILTGHNTGIAGRVFDPRRITFTVIVGRAALLANIKAHIIVLPNALFINNDKLLVCNSQGLGQLLFLQQLKFKIIIVPGIAARNTGIAIRKTDINDLFGIGIDFLGIDPHLIKYQALAVRITSQNRQRLQSRRTVSQVAIITMANAPHCTILKPEDGIVQRRRNTCHLTIGFTNGRIRPRTHRVTLKAVNLGGQRHITQVGRVGTSTMAKLVTNVVAPCVRLAAGRYRRSVVSACADADYVRNRLHAPLYSNGYGAL